MVVVRVVVAIVGVVAVDMKVLISVVVVMVVILMGKKRPDRFFIVFSFGHLESENNKKTNHENEKKNDRPEVKNE